MVCIVSQYPVAYPAIWDMATSLSLHTLFGSQAGRVDAYTPESSYATQKHARRHSVIFHL
jgi:hypothetical protein